MYREAVEIFAKGFRAAPSIFVLCRGEQESLMYVNK